MRIENADDARSKVRNYIVGTRSRHGKIASITMNDDMKGPDDDGAWSIKGTFVTEEGDKQDFVASVTSKGEVLMSSVPPAGNKNSPKTNRR
ncbi:MAG TPA: hypothetical protein VLV18_03550 [Terriglobales bacterium]|nr:hypothetical protein [Terriglobales bacterium]